MKTTKLYTLVALLLMAMMAYGQTYDSIAHHSAGWYDIDLRNMMQLRDGNILANIQLFEINENGAYLGDYGNRLLKIDPNGAVLIDSVFVEDDDLNYYLMERNPFGEDNVYAKVVRNLEECRSDLRISFFDDDLTFHPEKEVWVPLSDTVFPALCDSYFLDDHGDIILNFPLTKRKELHYYRIGLDGTVKDHAVLPKESSPINFYTSGGHRFGTFNESPTEYCYWGTNTSDLKTIYIHVFDSLLNLKETITPDGAPENIYFKCGMKERVLDWDANTFLVATRFQNEINFADNGVRITRYDKNNLTSINTCYFRTYPQIINGVVSLGCAFPIGLAKAGDGDMYFAYCTQDPAGVSNGTPVGQVSVVKMDADFNIVWQRFCLELEGYSRVGSELVALEDGGVAVGGVVMGAPPELFFLVFDDEGWSVSESGITPRPYSYWPNPVQNELHLQYSPDVTPTSIELYDLQGRLLHIQCNGMESIDVEGLPSGTYTMRVIMEDGKTFVEKILKH
ncbi:MAG: T9SS type A sorting domain-containing protein [Bacteroidales bacterium]|jgi:hypothetical protein|nr:T9SS type A sorting domain-containing protein [Bacteroidales bacterium]